MDYSIIPPIVVFAAVAVIIFLVVRRLPQTKKIADRKEVTKGKDKGKKRSRIFKLQSKKFPQWRGPKQKKSFTAPFRAMGAGMAGIISNRQEKKAEEKKDTKTHIQQAKREMAKKVEKESSSLPAPVKEVTDKDKSEIRNLSWEARKAVKKQEYTEAEKNYLKVIKLDDTDTDAYKGLGDVYIKMKNYTDAADAYQQVIKLGGRSEKIYLSLGEAFLKKESYPEAVDALEHVLKLNPQSATAYALIGQAHTEMDLHKEALKDFEEAVKLDEKNVGYLLLLAEAAERRGLKVEAKMHLRKLLEIDSENQKAQELLEKLG